MTVSWPEADRRVTVVIPNHNGAPWLQGCFQGLARQELEDFAVVLVDNGSTDGSPDLAQRLWPDLRLLILGQNRGFAAAVNAGIAESTSEYVALLNTDTIPGETWLSALVRTLERSPPAVAAVAPRMVRLDEPDTIDDAGNALDWTGAAKKVGHGRPSSDYADAREIFSPSAGASLYRRSFLQEMGGFD
jgi:GT2 family glycosyltransferase